MKKRNLLLLVVFILVYFLTGWLFENIINILFFVGAYVIVGLFLLYWYLFGTNINSNKLTSVKVNTDSSNKGILGEELVGRILYGYSTKSKGILYNDIIVGELDKTTQIDHLLITSNAIFIVETKRYSGGIFGDSSRDIWYQVIFKGLKKYKNSFLNPFKQNDHHIKRFEEYMGEINLPPIINIVCFVNNEDQTMDLSKIKISNKEYHLTDSNNLANLVKKIDLENKVSKTTTLGVQLRSDHLIEVKNRIAEIVVTDELERQNHIKRMKLKEVQHLENLEKAE